MAGAAQPVHTSSDLWLLIDEALGDIDARCLEARAAESEPGGVDLVEIRHDVRERLRWLEARLAEMLTGRDVHFVLFPLVIHLDEVIRTISRGTAARWEPLQSELYDIENGGELFYTSLEDLLRQAETAPIVFEVFYYCLSNGFQGMYQDEPRKTTDYQARLAERIPEVPVRRHEDAEAVPAELVHIPLLYYAVAAGAALVAYLAVALFGYVS